MNIKQTITTAVLLLIATSANSTLIFHTDYTSFDAASSAVLVEDFEAYPTKDAPLSSVYSNGISYTPTGVTSNVWVSSPGYTNYGIPGATTSSILTATGDEHFLITPDSSLSAIGFDVYLNQYSPAYVNVFGTSGLLGTFDLTTLPSTQVGFLGMTSTNAITSLEWFTTLGGRVNTGIDNVYTEGYAVPEPSIMILLASGLMVFGLVRRKKA
jgi:hypothetical protein